MKPIYVQLQRNNIRNFPENELQYIFDLKGSRYKR